MKTAEDYIKTMMWNGGNTTEEKINWILTDYKQSIIELIEDIQTIELLRGWKHTSDILEELIAKIKEVK